MSAALAVEIQEKEAAVKTMQTELRALRKRKLKVEEEEEEATVLEALAGMQTEGSSPVGLLAFSTLDALA